MGREPMMSWIEGFLTDCEDDPALDGGDLTNGYRLDEILGAVRWLYDRAERHERARDLAAAVVRNRSRGTGYRTIADYAEQDLLGLLTEDET